MTEWELVSGHFREKTYRKSDGRLKK